MPINLNNTCMFNLSLDKQLQLLLNEILSMITPYEKKIPESWQFAYDIAKTSVEDKIRDIANTNCAPKTDISVTVDDSGKMTVDFIEGLKQLSFINEAYMNFNRINKYSGLKYECNRYLATALYNLRRIYALYYYLSHNAVCVLNRLSKLIPNEDMWVPIELMDSTMFISDDLEAFTQVTIKTLPEFEQVNSAVFVSCGNDGLIPLIRCKNRKESNGPMSNMMRISDRDCPKFEDFHKKLQFIRFFRPDLKIRYFVRNISLTRDLNEATFDDELIRQKILVDPWKN